MVNADFTGQVQIVSTWPCLGKTTAARIWNSDYLGDMNTLVKAIDLDYNEFKVHYTGVDMLEDYCRLVCETQEKALSEHNDWKETVFIFVGGEKVVRKALAKRGMDFYYIRPDKVHLPWCVGAARARAKMHPELPYVKTVATRMEKSAESLWENDFFCREQTVLEITSNIALVGYLQQHVQYFNETDYYYARTLADKAKECIRESRFGEFTLDPDGRILARTPVLASGELDEIMDAAGVDSASRGLMAFSRQPYVALPKEAVIDVLCRIEQIITEMAESKEYNGDMDHAVQTLLGNAYSNYMLINNAVAGYIGPLWDKYEEE